MNELKDKNNFCFNCKYSEEQEFNAHGHITCFHNNEAIEVSYHCAGGCTWFEGKKNLDKNETL